MSVTKQVRLTGLDETRFERLKETKIRWYMQEYSITREVAQKEMTDSLVLRLAIADSLKFEIGRLPA